MTRYFTIDGLNKRFLVHHQDGTTEVFATSAAMYAAYPELRVMPGKQTKTQRRNERIQAGQRV